MANESKPLEVIQGNCDPLPNGIMQSGSLMRIKLEAEVKLNCELAHQDHYRPIQALLAANIYFATQRMALTWSVRPYWFSIRIVNVF